MANDIWYHMRHDPLHAVDMTDVDVTTVDYIGGWRSAHLELRGWAGEMDHPRGCECVPCGTVRRVLEMVKWDHEHRPGWWD